LIEDNFGVNMNYYTAHNVPNNLITPDVRNHIKTRDVEELKKLVFTGIHQIDDPVDMYSKHTILHDAVMLDIPELFEFAL